MYNYVGGVSLLLGILFTFFSLLKWGVNSVSNGTPSRITPYNQAFSIWTPIFGLSIYKSIYAITSYTQDENDTTLVLLCISYVACAFWVYYSSYKYYKYALFFIISACILAIYAHMLEKRPQQLPDWISQSAGAMLGSWLSIASLIYLDYTLSTIVFDPIVPLFMATFIGAISIYFEKPLLMISIIWASFYLRKYSLLALFVSFGLGSISIYNFTI